MEDKKAIKIHGVLWIKDHTALCNFHAICPIHHLRMKPYPEGFSEFSAYQLSCVDCETVYVLPQEIIKDKEYIKDKLDSKIFKKLGILNLDDEAIPLAESRISSKDNKFFVTAIMVESKVGKRVIIYGGEKGKKEKAQIFIEPEIARLAFDQKDLHPSDVFVKVEATFRGGIKSSIERK